MGGQSPSISQRQPPFPNLHKVIAMRNKSLLTAVLLLVLALGSGVTIAQLFQPGGVVSGGVGPGGVLDGARPTPAYENSVEMQPGSSYLIHASDDTAIEILVDVPISVSETMTYENPRVPGKFTIPNQTAFRAQGPVLISRSAQSNTIAKLYVRWRYVETIFSTYSRSPKIMAGPPQ